MSTIPEIVDRQWHKGPFHIYYSTHKGRPMAFTILIGEATRGRSARTIHRHGMNWPEWDGVKQFRRRWVSWLRMSSISIDFNKRWMPFMLSATFI